MKKIYNILLSGCMMAGISLALTSCTDYLDKSADSTLSEDEAYKNFTTYQGFVEEIYNCIPDKENCNWNVSFNLGDDEVMDTQSNGFLGPQFDLGNFWAWQTSGCNWFYQGTVDPTSTTRFDHSIYGHAWYCIRKANIGIANINKMTECTQEEKNLILGQLYFFRAWWHFEMMQYLGGIPYITSVLPSTNCPQLPRLTFQQCADSAAVDFRKAADLLPVNWDNTTVGKNTLGKNDLRINKIMALGYLGKDYLWAGSPLMKDGAMMNAGNKTYDYDENYCHKAAEALGELLNYVEGGQTQYALAEFKYSDVYNHLRDNSAKTCFSDIFYTQGQNWKLPGTCEAIMRSSDAGVNSSNWGFDRSFGPIDLTDGGVVHQPTANYVNYAYGMANGLPIDDPESGFDPTHPFKNRDPRFYHDIVYDGCKYIKGTLTTSFERYRYCNMSTDSIYRSDTKGTRTGYLYQKLAPHNCNKWDGGLEWAGATTCSLPYMRLADIYLMYAEACAAFGGASAKSNTFSKTAEQAINTLRDRVGEGHVGSKYVADKLKFMDEVRRERAAELAFEGFRFCDLQRWLLLTNAKYEVKTSQEFQRVEPLSYFQNTNNDPADAEVKGWSEKTIVTRHFSTRNYWLPFFKKDVSLYEGFDQNPGW
ncbi:MAG: RagB/SusD family nutrient uptake outer membrane protein [Prevotella sp.]|jgi:hypothetical protein|nr:RagB/SusD family nutrient uptake outer membrane protein [Prevotella sp.]MCI1281914.1 RagB/SusD family nutrient uptake outer membrane protein [Prevotella sp.]